MKPSKSALAGLLIVAAAGVCVRLGIWQLARLEERKARNEVINMQLAHPMVDVGPSNAELAPFRRARATGTFDFERQIVEVGRSVGGVPGVYIVTPLVMADGRAVLVERGWAASPDARRIDLSVLREPVLASVEGILLERTGTEMPRPGWPAFVRQVDPRDWSSLYPYELIPLVLRRTGNPPEVQSVGFGAIPPPEVTEGPHLGYAIQWFLFATVAVVGGFVGLARQGRPQGSRRAIDIQPPEPQSRS